MTGRFVCAALGLLLALAMCGQGLAQVPPPPPPSPTLWSFLGIPQGLYKVHGHMVNRRGNHPRLEKKPPLKAIADVANLKSDVPAIKAAAEIKQAEDLKPQKIKAIKYLATIGCGCYDKDEKVTKALLAAMEDCTEEVRLAAVNAVAEAAESEYCQYCKERSCCNEKLVAQLSKLAYERDDNGCFVEPSERVRQAAMEALGTCCADRGGPLPIEQPLPPVEGAEPPPVEGAPGDEPPPLPVADPVARRQPAAEQPFRDAVEVTRSSSRRTRSVAQAGNEEAEPAFGERSVLAAVSHTNTSQHEPVTPAVHRAAPVFRKVTGVVSRVNQNLGMVQLQLHNEATLPVGATVQVYHHAVSGDQLSAVLKIIDSEPGLASAQLLGTSRVHRFAPGEEITVWK